ncbi:MAG: DUF4276 family protein [Chloroflexota bacterium]
MNRPLRIGLLAEGPAELGRSVPYLRPEDGGKVIPQSDEGALHALIRRELAQMDIQDCAFIHRHPSRKERRKGQVRVGYSILEPRYLAQIVSMWKPEEIDMIVVVVDADAEIEKRQQRLETALDTIRDNHLDVDENEIDDQSSGGLAIRSLEAWLLADAHLLKTKLSVKLPTGLLKDLEILPADSSDAKNAKNILDAAISSSSYLSEFTVNKREMQIRWELGAEISLSKIKQHCPQGYVSFVNSLVETAQRTVERYNLY